MSDVYIYGLKDPHTNEIRYVGKTVNPKMRLVNHLVPDRVNHHKANWIAELKRAGLRPVMVILETTDESHWEAREKYWIKTGRESGWRLTNIAEGGHSNFGLSGETFADLLALFTDDDSVECLSDDEVYTLAWEAAKMVLPTFRSALNAQYPDADPRDAAIAHQTYLAVSAYVNGQLNILNGV